MISTKKCQTCNKEFVGVKQQKHCGTACNAKAWRLRHPERFKLSHQTWDKKNPMFKKEYIQKNRKLLTINKNTRYANDPLFKLKEILRTRLSKAIRRSTKTGSAVKDLGCSIDYLKSYLESKFQPGMTWDNYGEWHIDHIRPLNGFDLTKLEQLKIACHYSNLQPLWAIENRRKSDHDQY